MKKIENEIAYKATMARIEELLPLVDDNTPKDDKNLIELDLLSHQCGCLGVTKQFPQRLPVGGVDNQGPYLHDAGHPLFGEGKYIPFYMGFVETVSLPASEAAGAHGRVSDWAGKQSRSYAAGNA